MRAELWTAAGYVAGFDLPPFVVPREVLFWGTRSFVRSSDRHHLPQCFLTMNPDVKQADRCNCGGVWSYLEAVAYTVADSQQIEKGRDKPITPHPIAPVFFGHVTT